MSEAPWLPPDRTFASFLDKVVVKTKTDYEPDRKKGKGRVHKIAEFTVSVTESMSERFKVSGGGVGAGEALLGLGRVPSRSDDLGRDRTGRIWADPAAPNHWWFKKLHLPKWSRVT